MCAYKIGLVGPSGSGKSRCLACWLGGAARMFPTLGAEVCHIHVYDRFGQPVEVNVWDMAGSPGHMAFLDGGLQLDGFLVFGDDCTPLPRGAARFRADGGDPEATLVTLRRLVCAIELRRSTAALRRAMSEPGRC